MPDNTAQGAFLNFRSCLTVREDYDPTFTAVIAFINTVATPPSAFESKPVVNKCLFNVLKSHDLKTGNF